MVAVEKYIRKLLYEQDCVIIPELGGLLTHHINAQYNSASGMFAPSQKRVAFNEVLKLDDGLLTYFISVNEKISREEAMSCVKKYTESLRASLREEGKAAIPGVGDFQTNSEGKLVFEPDSTQNFNVDWFGFQPIKAAELNSVGVASHVVEEPVLKAVPVIEATEVHSMEEEMSEEEETNRKMRWGWSGWAAAAVAAGMAFYLSVFYAPSGTNSMLSTLNPFYGVKEYVQTTMAEKQIAESKDDLTIVVEEDDLVIAPEETQTAADLPATVPAQPIVASAAVAGPTKPAEVVQKATTPVVTPVNNVVKKYYIIAGSFESMKNAEILLTQLQQGGFSSAFIMEQKVGNLIKVSATGYDTMSEAYNNLNAVEKIAGEGVWVYKNRL